ncbi:MAG: SDR family NAD(P)-dependent oxidoreductase [Crocinitomicaceae bacterium]|nr:SDR family NAD(P)-dependent oxidoreductase [Crocinitomicaceae bacterium]
MHIVTGVSRGLGEAIAKALLDSNHTVLGIGRSHSIDHPSFSFVTCDLADNDALENLDLNINSEEPITLINNAGIIGEIKRLSDQDSSDLTQVLQVNTVAPMLLAKKVYQQISNKDNFTLVNISSGAANRAIPSWAGYCASKAALNMLSEAFYLEETEKGNHPKVYAVAPGVIDTDMQVQIRTAGAENFSAIDNFIAMKENNELYSAAEGAARLLKLLDQPFSGTVSSDLRTV